MISIAESETKIEAVQSINKIVHEELLNNNIKYSDFIIMKINQNGDIYAVEVNTVEMNKFGALISNKIQEDMKFIGGRGINIPLGMITRSNIFSFYGPKIMVKTYPIGNVLTDFKSEIESVGINQSRYRVYILINVDLQIIIPIGKDKVNITSSIPIAETLIVGKVPITYFNNQRN